MSIVSRKPVLNNRGDVDPGNPSGVSDGSIQDFSESDAYVGLAPGAFPAAPGANPSGAASGGSTLTVGSGRGIIFQDSFDSSCTQAFINCVVAAQETYRNLFSNNITLKFDFTE